MKVKKAIAFIGVTLLAVGGCSFIKPIPMLSAQAITTPIVDNEPPRYYSFNNNFTVTHAEYVNVAGGSVRFYRYTLSYNMSPMLTDSNLDFLRRGNLFFELPLSFLNYDYSSNITLTSNSITKTLINDTLILIGDSALMTSYTTTMFIKDNTFNSIFVIPTNDTIAKSGYAQAFDNLIAHNKNSLLFTIASGSYTNGFLDGYDEAIDYYNGVIDDLIESYNTEIDLAYDSGLSEGIGIGYQQGVSSTGGLNWLKAVFDTTASIMAIEIMPGFTLGFVALFPLVILLVKFILSWGKGD